MDQLLEFAKHLLHDKCFCRKKYVTGWLEFYGTVVIILSRNWPGSCHRESQAGDSIPRQTGWTCDRTRTCSDTSPDPSRSGTPAHTASACLCLGSGWMTGSTLACPTGDTVSQNTLRWCTTVERQIIKISVRLEEESWIKLLRAISTILTRPSNVFF